MFSFISNVFSCFIYAEKYILLWLRDCCYCYCYTQWMFICCSWVLISLTQWKQRELCVRLNTIHTHTSVYCICILFNRTRGLLVTLSGRDENPSLQFITLYSFHFSKAEHPHFGDVNSNAFKPTIHRMSNIIFNAPSNDYLRKHIEYMNWACACMINMPSNR